MLCLHPISHLLIRTVAADWGVYVVDRSANAAVAENHGKRSSIVAALTAPLRLLVRRRRSNEWLYTSQVVAAFRCARVINERATAEQGHDSARLVYSKIRGHITPVAYTNDIWRMKLTFALSRAAVGVPIPHLIPGDLLRQLCESARRNRR